jgi:hypothetical protein
MLNSLWFGRVRDRYNLWVETKGQDVKEVTKTVAALTGMDQRLARKLVDAKAPVRGGIDRREVRYLQARFADWGLIVRVKPEFEELHDPVVDGPVQTKALSESANGPQRAIAGVMIGVYAWLGISGVLLFPIALGSLIGSALGRGSTDSPIITAFVISCLYVVPLLGSCVAGVFWGWRFRRRGSLGRVALSVTGLALALVLDADGPIDLARLPAVVGVHAFCTVIAAPLSAAITSHGRMKMTTTLDGRDRSSAANLESHCGSNDLP